MHQTGAGEGDDLRLGLAPPGKRRGPLPCAVEGEDLPTGQDDAAIDQAGHQRRELVGDDGDHRLVEKREPGFDFALSDQRAPLQMQRAGHQIGVLEPRSDRGRRPLPSRRRPPSLPGRVVARPWAAAHSHIRRSRARPPGAARSGQTSRLRDPFPQCWPGESQARKRHGRRRRALPVCGARGGSAPEPPDSHRSGSSGMRPSRDAEGPRRQVGVPDPPARGSRGHWSTRGDGRPRGPAEARLRSWRSSTRRSCRLAECNCNSAAPQPRSNPRPFWGTPSVSAGAQRQVAEVKPTPPVIHVLSVFRSAPSVPARRNDR